MTNAKPAVIVHGGAGPIRDDSLPDRLDGCKAAALAAWEIVAQNGSALDAAEAAVMILENNPLFNAGTGSTLNQAGKVEMDAAIMDGDSLRAGAVAAVQRIKNPIKLARRILEDGRHIILAGDGALKFAWEIGVPQCSPESLIAEHEREGCVVLDGNGKIAVATSTGGIFNKLPGRIGDSPLPGCGTYADDRGGVSCTGLGEAIIRVVLGKTAIDILSEGIDPNAAARKSLELLEAKTGAQAGLILIDCHGRIGYARNTTHMPVCYIKDNQSVTIDS
jgi:beta-aspartyl-peptidase (threonine type)